MSTPRAGKLDKKRPLTVEEHGNGIGKWISFRPPVLFRRGLYVKITPWRSLGAGLLAVIGAASPLLIAGAAAASPGIGRPSVTRAVPTDALDAAGWLGRQFLANGDLPTSAGAAGLNNLPAALLALVAAGTGETRLERGLAYLKANFKAYVSTKSQGKSIDLPGRLA